MDVKELLKKRRTLKNKKPEFIRQDAHKKKKVGWKWRKPKGSDSKMRVSRRGYKRIVKVGWGSPKAVKGLDRSGLLPVVVDNLKALQQLDPKKEVAVLSSTVGTKKKMLLVKEAMSKNIQISNCKDPKKFLDDMKDIFEKKKKDKATVKEQRKKKKEDSDKEASKKKEKEEKAAKEDESKDESRESEEEKKKEEKKEQDKLLITTQ